MNDRYEKIVKQYDRLKKEYDLLEKHRDYKYKNLIAPIVVSPLIFGFLTTIAKHQLNH